MSMVVPVLARPVVFAQSTNSNSSVLTLTEPGPVANISASSIEKFVNSLTTTIMEIGWGIVILAFVVGWVIRGSPIPFYDLKDHGHRFIYDAILAAVFISIGSTLFYIINSLVLHL